MKTDSIKSLHVRALKNDTLKLPLKPLLVVSAITLTVFAYHIYLTHFFSQQAQTPGTPTTTEGVANETRMAASTTNTAASVTTASSEPTNSVSQPPIASPPFDNDTKAVMLECLKNVRAFKGIKSPKDFINLREFLEKAVQPPGRAPVETRLGARRLRLIDQNGKRLRLHITPHPEAANAGEQLEVNLFSFNEDNLPVRMPLTEEMKSATIFETIDRFKSRGQVEMDEISETMLWDTQTHANVIRQNGKVLSLHINFHNGELNCRASDSDQARISCVCL